MKLKTNKSVSKRFRKTGSGKLVARKSCRGHLLMQKSTRQKKLANKPKLLVKGDAKRVAKLIPNI